MPAPAAAPTRTTRPAPKLGRNQVVWLSLFVSLFGVGGLLMGIEGRPLRLNSGVALAELEPIAATTDLGAIFDTNRPLDTQRWHGIVIHHSGSAMGSPDSITQEHTDRGYHGLGYHFVVGNGQGARDGSIHVGYRWQDQLPGVHVSGPNAETYNQRTIGICLIGDGDRRRYTRAQLASLALLVSQLQAELGLPDSAVQLGRDVSATSGPGRLFPAAAFRAELASRH